MPQQNSGSAILFLSGATTAAAAAGYVAYCKSHNQPIACPIPQHYRDNAKVVGQKLVDHVIDALSDHGLMKKAREEEDASTDSYSSSSDEIEIVQAMEDIMSEMEQNEDNIDVSSEYAPKKQHRRRFHRRNRRNRQIQSGCE